MIFKRASEEDVREEVEQEQGFLSHLKELRDRLLRSVLAVLILFLALFPFADTIYSVLAEPLMRHMPEGTNMIAIEVASPFLIPVKMVLMLAIFIAVPYLFYQLWSFVAPGLYLHERRLVMPLLASSTVLFFMGVAFAYFLVFPLAFAFFNAVAPTGVEVMTDIGRYLDFVITIFFAFGIAFEVPIATIVLVAVGATTPEKLAKKRPYIIVGAFVVGMFLTPPDIISQTLLALPMWALFEVGILFSKYLLPRHLARHDAEQSTPGDAVPATEPPVGTWHDDEPGDDEEYRPLSDAEMEAELDRSDAEDAETDSDSADQPDDGAADDGGDETKPPTG
jgi:sec-independent protein translocase protein TatC